MHNCEILQTKVMPHKFTTM